MQKELLRLSGRGLSRTAFLREASSLLLALTRSDAVHLWLEDGDLRYRWEASVKPHQEVRFTRLSSARDSAPARAAMALGVHPLVAEALAHGDALAEVGDAAQPTPEGGVCLDASAGSGTYRSIALLPFAIDSRNQGVLELRSLRPRAFRPSKLQEHAGLADLLGVAVASRRSQAALTERVKELTCMYNIAQLAAESDRPLEEILQAVVELLPPAWQFPEITTASITIAGVAYVTPGFERGPHRLAADIRVAGQVAGQLEVFYTERWRDREEVDVLEDAPFLPEERNLIEGVARELRFIIERKRSEQERATLQEQIRHADRLATIGQLAAGVAHELNEPLANILGFAQLVSRNHELPEQVRRDIERIVSASLYAREVIRKLMLFARQDAPRDTASDLNRVVDDALSLLESRCAKAGIRVVRALGESLPTFHGDGAQLQQVIVNLAVNAIQAMPQGGTLIVGTAAYEDQVCVFVEDTGVGMPESVIENLFVPFFTTKDVGEGTGLGLSVVHGIVTAHGGTVSVKSSPGQGSRFEVCMPAHPAQRPTRGDDAV